MADEAEEEDFVVLAGGARGDGAAAPAEGRRPAQLMCRQRARAAGPGPVENRDLELNISTRRANEGRRLGWDAERGASSCVRTHTGRRHFEAATH